jgi:hypothetical protein
MGDGALVEFGSVVDAVNCAVAAADHAAYVPLSTEADRHQDLMAAADHRIYAQAGAIELVDPLGGDVDSVPSRGRQRSAATDIEVHCAAYLARRVPSAARELRHSLTSMSSSPGRRHAG